MPNSRPRRAAERCARAQHWCVLAASALTAVCALSHTSHAQAEICKYVDPDGKVHYTNVAPERGWKKQSCDGEDFVAPKKSTPPGNATTRSATPAGFPKVDSSTQKGRDDVRRKVLSDELSIEEKLLIDARKAYADGAPAPLPEEKADADKYRDRISKLRQTLTVHEKNVEALKKELASIK
jgi:hypothetical protein